MDAFIKRCPSITTAFILAVTTVPTILADHPVGFPWPGSPQSAWQGAPQSGIYRMLPQASSGLRGDLHPKNHSTLPPDSYRMLPPKKHYAYGWFGSNPHPQWGVHFKYTNDHIQWTRR